MSPGFAWSGRAHDESVVAVTERQEKGRALKSVKKSLVEHQLLKHADSRETMQITWPGLHLVSFLPPVPHTLNPLLCHPQDKQSYRCGLPLSRMLCWCKGITLTWVCLGALRGCASSVVRTQMAEHHSPFSLSFTQQHHHFHHLGQTHYDTFVRCFWQIGYTVCEGFE